jgi:nucleotide-binding universal stress UspA family protein
MFKPSRILVPTDLSDHSDKALRHAFDIARKYDARVFMLHVIQDPVQQCTMDYCLREELVDKLQGEINQSVRTGMLRQLAKFPSVDPASVVTDVKTGVPHEEILKEADEMNIDLIVIASLGSSGLSKYLMGSVARHVLIAAKCPVLLSR